MTGSEAGAGVGDVGGVGGVGGPGGRIEATLAPLSWNVIRLAHP